MYFLWDKDQHMKEFTDEEIIANAMEQESEGIEPHFAYKYGDGSYSDKGYLVANMYSGCIVAVKNAYGKYHIFHGFQGDFAMLL